MQSHLAVGMPGPELPDEATEMGAVGGGGEPDAQRAGDADGVVASLGERAVKGGQGWDQVAAEVFPGRGEADPAAGAVEQPTTKACLQAANGFTDTRLGDPQPFRGPSEVQLLGENHEDAELTKFHRSPHQSPILIGGIGDWALKGSRRQLIVDE